MAEKAMTPEEYFRKLSKEDKSAIVNLKSSKTIDFIPTGSWVLNAIIGDGTLTGKPGGFPRGHVVEVFGDESSGKTTVALSACKQVQMMGGLPVFVDFERTFHPIYAQSLGVDLSPNKFILIKPDHFQHGVKMILDSLLMKPWLVVVDSVSAMIPKEFLEGSIDEAGRMGMQAQLMSKSLNHLTKVISETNTCLLYTNQLRSVIKKSKYDRGPDEQSTGGFALRFYASLRLKLLTSTIERVNMKSRITGKVEKEPINLTVKATAIKNKIDKPYLSGPIYIRFGKGVDNHLSILELAINIGVIKKEGAFYSFFEGKTELFKVQGKEQACAFLASNQEIFKKLRDRLVFKQDEQAAIEDEVSSGDEDDLDAILEKSAKAFGKSTKTSEPEEEPAKDDVEPDEPKEEKETKEPKESPKKKK